MIYFETKIIINLLKDTFPKGELTETKYDYYYKINDDIQVKFSNYCYDRENKKCFETMPDFIIFINVDYYGNHILQEKFKKYLDLKGIRYFYLEESFRTGDEWYKFIKDIFIPFMKNNV